MDYISVVKGDEAMHQKLELFSDKVRDGHAPFLSDMDLQAYAMAGIATDHECSDFAYAMKERRNGMIVHIREGSAARNLKAIVNGIVENQMNGEDSASVQMINISKILKKKVISTIMYVRLSDSE